MIIDRSIGQISTEILSFMLNASRYKDLGCYAITNRLFLSENYRVTALDFKI